MGGVEGRRERREREWEGVCERGKGGREEGRGREGEGERKREREREKRVPLSISCSERIKAVRERDPISYAMEVELHYSAIPPNVMEMV